MKTKKQIQQNIDSNNKDNDNCKLTYKEFHDRDIVLKAQLEMIEGFEKEIVGFLGKLQSVFNIQGETISWETDVDNWEEIKEELNQKISG